MLAARRDAMSSVRPVPARRLSPRVAGQGALGCSALGRAVPPFPTSEPSLTARHHCPIQLSLRVQRRRRWIHRTAYELFHRPEPF